MSPYSNTILRQYLTRIIRLTSFMFYHKDKCQQQPCPSSFPNLDTRHRYMIEHGDVCRNGKVHGYNVGWTCPCGCVSVGNRAPWCTNKNGGPCRVKGLLYYLYQSVLDKA